MEKNHNRVVHISVPLSMAIGPIPPEVQTSSQIYTFGLANVQHIFGEKGLTARLDAKRAIATYVDGHNPPVTINGLGKALDDRAYQVQPTDDGKFELQFSTNGGDTFTAIATVDSEAMAHAFGDAWVDGRAEPEE